MPDKPIKMKSSSSDSNKTPAIPTIPQFAWCLYLDEKGEMHNTYNLTGGFPKDEILPGMLKVAQHIKDNLLDHLLPGAGDLPMAELEKLIATKTPPENDEKGARSDKVLKLDTLPTDEG